MPPYIGMETLAFRQITRERLHEVCSCIAAIIIQENMLRRLIAITLLPAFLSACESAKSTEEKPTVPVQILTCTGMESDSFTEKPASRALRFDENTGSLTFWFDNDRVWGHSILTDSQNLDVRDDFLVWRGHGPGGSRTIRIDRVSGAISDEQRLPNSLNIFTNFEGTCTSEPEQVREPLTADQRRF